MMERASNIKLINGCFRPKNFLDAILFKQQKIAKDIFSPSIFTYICTLFLSCNLGGKPRTSNQSRKMQSCSVKISKQINLLKRKPKIWPSFLNSSIQIFYIFTDRELARKSIVISKGCVTRIISLRVEFHPWVEFSQASVQTYLSVYMFN